MPQIDQSGKIGKSSSPIMEKVIQNNTNVQQPVKAPAVVDNGQQFNKCPVKI